MQPEDQGSKASAAHTTKVGNLGTKYAAFSTVEKVMNEFSHNIFS